MSNYRPRPRTSTNSSGQPLPGSLSVSTDGACLRNPGGPSAWAWYVDESRWAAGAFEVGTNQQAELLAVLAALSHLPADMPLTLILDSRYALDACTKWIAGWKRAGWTRRGGAPIANLELMQALDAAMSARLAEFRFIWVRGHNGHPLNEAADVACSRAARALAAGKSVPTGPGWNASPGTLSLYR